MSRPLSHKELEELCRKTAPVFMRDITTGWINNILLLNDYQQIEFEIEYIDVIRTSKKGEVDVHADRKCIVCISYSHDMSKKPLPKKLVIRFPACSNDAAYEDEKIRKKRQGGYRELRLHLLKREALYYFGGQPHTALPESKSFATPQCYFAYANTSKPYQAVVVLEVLPMAGSDALQLPPELPEINLKDTKK